jgi:hypothetical protein
MLYPSWSLPGLDILGVEPLIFPLLEELDVQIGVAESNRDARHEAFRKIVQPRQGVLKKVHISATNSEALIEYLKANVFCVIVSTQGGFTRKYTNFELM